MAKNPDQYWDKSWNPLKIKGGGFHCTKCSPGCLNCWAEKYNLRFHNKIPYDDRLVEFALDNKVLEQPIRRTIPTTYFVCDLCDLFHKDVPFEFIDKVYAIAAICPQHNFLLLTKRIKQAYSYYFTYTQLSRANRICHVWVKIKGNETTPFPKWPFPNVQLGVTICNQAEADEKIPILLQIPAAHRWLSIEPLLGEINFLDNPNTFYQYGCAGSTHYGEGQGRKHIHDERCQIPFDWIVVGCESGPKRRPCKPEWIKSIVEQCQAAGVGCCVKQMEINGKVEHDMKLFPKWARAIDEL